MPKKIDSDSTMKKVEDVSNTVNIIMRNRLIIAIFLIVDGITFILNPNSSLEGMARNIILLVLLAAASILITNLFSKTKNVKTIVISIIILAIGIITYIYPDLVAAYIQLILSLFIIYNGLTNISAALNLGIVSKYTNIIKEKYNKILNSKKTKKKQTEKFNDINKNFDEGMEQQTEKLINPIKNMLNKTNKASTLYIVINVASIILGLILLIFPNVSMVLWGGIFLYTGISDLLVAMSTMNITQKIKEKKFKEILFGEDKK